MPPRKRRMTRVQADLPRMPDCFTLMGWCMTDQHEDCRVQFVSSLTGATYTCSCGCHGLDTKQHAD